MSWTRILWVLGLVWCVFSLPLTPWAQAEEVQELGTKVVQGLEVTCVVRPPLSPAQMTEMMRKMGMGGMMGMQGMPMPRPTHYMGVIVKDAKTGKVMQGLTISLKAEGAARTQPVRLWAMPGSYAKGVVLPRKGPYTILFTIEGPMLKTPVEVSFNFVYR